MANQVVNWIYSDQDDVRRFNNIMDYNVEVDTLLDAFNYFATTYTIDGYANILDNRYEDAGLIIRPLTTPEGKTGVMSFTITHPDAKYRSNGVCAYGQNILHDVVEMVFRAAGLDIDEDYLTLYRNRVITEMGLQPGLQQLLRVNTCIENASGGYKTLSFVDKIIVDRILDAMAKQGMFNVHYDDLPDEILADSTLKVEAVNTLDEMLDYMVPEIMNSAMVAAYKEAQPSMADWTLSAAEVRTFIDAGFALQNLSPDDYDYFIVDINFQNPKGYIYQKPDSIEITVTMNNFIDDEITNYSQYGGTDITRTDYDPETQEGRSGWAYGYATNAFMRNVEIVDQYYDRHRLSFFLKYDIEAGHCVLDTSWFSSTNGYSYERGANSNCGIYDEQQSYYKPFAPFDPAMWYATWKQSNYGFEGTYPAGISKHEGAMVPKNVDSLTTAYWGSWATRSYQNHLLDYMTYVALGYGEFDNPSWTQARVQSGEIYNDHYQERLGVNVEALDDFTPISVDIYGEDPERVPTIKPDPNPTPTPTPGGEDPSLSSARLFTVHMLNNNEVNALGNFLFSNTFLDAMKNMFQEPLNAIIGCISLTHGGTLPLGASETLKLGSILGGTGVTGTVLTNQFQMVPCGAVNINEYYNNVEDYDYTTAQIFLPYIGYRDLDIKEIMGGRIEVNYWIDCFSGACVARIFVTRDGVRQELYNFTGNCAITIPLTGRDFTTGITSLLSGALGVAGGAITGNALAMAYGASNLIGNESKITRSGSLGANIGAMASQKPFIVIKRPVPYNARSYNAFYGKPSNWTVTLSQCDGYTRIKDVHLDNVACTDAEKDEIVTLLKQGVIF